MSAERGSRPPTGLSWGCGPAALPPGWVGSDLVDHGQSHVGDIRDGLPWPDETFDAVSTNHALQMLPWLDVRPALAELRRVTRPGGWLRVVVPDLLRGVRAFERGDPSPFKVADDIEEGLNGKLCVWVTQAGATRSVFTPAVLLDLLGRAGWSGPRLVPYGSTGSGRADLLSMDSRADESVVAEAQR